MFYLFPLGRVEEAIRAAKRALEDNPLSQVLHHCLAHVLDGAGLVDEARGAFEKAIDLDPRFWLGFYALSVHLALREKLDEARRAAEQAYAISSHPYTIGALAGLMRNKGESAQSEALLAKLPSGSLEALVGMAVFHFVQREFNEAMDYTAMAIDAGYAPFLIFPYARLLRDTPRWPELMTKLNLPASR